MAAESLLINGANKSAVGVATKEATPNVYFCARFEKACSEQPEMPPK
jgi:hypothetical protein